ncbi:hypothetical protein N7486_009098 [Penicillium sp. IBT 16267x]|nr:hypothetical protein N7486_009098 [Penicillium sp. IBT 16267x]
MDDIPGSRMPKACKTCAKAKVRCEPAPNGACKRCQRLKKECSGQTPGSHRRARPARGNLSLTGVNSEVSALEAKLDRMVELLAASERSRDAQSNTSHSPEQSSTQPDEDSAAPDGQDDDALMDIF